MFLFPSLNLRLNISCTDPPGSLCMLRVGGQLQPVKKIFFCTGSTKPAKAGKWTWTSRPARKGTLSNVLDESSLIASILKIWYATPSSSGIESESKFLDVIGTKVLRVFLLAIHLYLRILLPLSPLLEQKWFETVPLTSACSTCQSEKV